MIFQKKFLSAYPVFFIILLGYLITANTSYAKEQITTDKQSQTDKSVTDSKQPLGFEKTVERLQEIRSSLALKRKELAEIEKAANQTKSTVERNELNLQAERLNNTITELEESFEQMASGGLDMKVLEDKPQPLDFNWQKELALVARPLFDDLKELTEKSRKVDLLRTQIARLEMLQEQLQHANTALELLQQQAVAQTIKEQLNQLAQTWSKREKETEEALKLARYQLNNLLENRLSPAQAIYKVLKDFFEHRAITLMAAIVGICLVWLLMRTLLSTLFKIFHLDDPDKAKFKSIRLINYGFWGGTVLLSFLAAIVVFYARNDFLLLSLAVLFLLMLIFSLRTALPRYIQEIRLLLDIGPVRKGERITYNNIPYLVKTIGVYSTLENPELEGTIRLPSHLLIDMVSKPYQNELWFPSSSGDYLMLEGDRFVQVIQQSTDYVQVKMMGSPVMIPTATFLQQASRNLSRDGFVVPVTFGIDYQHQADCLTTVPEVFKADLKKAFADAGLEDALNDLIVDFKEAGMSSLDYIIVAIMAGEAASNYFAIGRLIQKTCVEVCNRKDWGIPFNQLTIHQADNA